MRKLIIMLSALALAAGASPASTQSLSFGDWLWVGGFGGVATGSVDGSDYLVGDNATAPSVALSAVALPHPSFAAYVQGEGHHVNGVTDGHIDFALLEWRPNPAFHLRAGKVKHPFGLYTEVFHVGTVRPFFTLPQSIYGPSGIIAEGLLGASVTGRVGIGSDRWSLEYDAYAGSIEIMTDGRHGFFLNPITGEDVPQHGEEGHDHDRHHHTGDATLARHSEMELTRVGGGRLNLATPLDGFRVGVSGYAGSMDSRHHGLTHNHSAIGSHAEYVGGPWSLRSEVAYTKFGQEGTTATGYYVEAARRVRSDFELGLRYDYSQTDIEDADTSEAPTLLAHREWAATANYWVNSRVVVKVSYHNVDGNRFAVTHDLHMGMETASLIPQTDLLLAGVQFSF